jgi:thiamine kinase-like enzyme
MVFLTFCRTDIAVCEKVFEKPGKKKVKNKRKEKYLSAFIHNLIYKTKLLHLRRHFWVFIFFLTINLFKNLTLFLICRN